MKFRPKRLLLLLIIMSIIILHLWLFSMIPNQSKSDEIGFILIAIFSPMLWMGIFMVIPEIILGILSLIGFETDIDWMWKFTDIFPDWFVE